MLSKLARLSLIVVALSCAAATDPRYDHIQVRLTSSIGSYSPAGTAFQARVIGPVLPTEPALARGTIIHGVVRATRSVGMGFRRERAFLELGLNRCETPHGGEDVPCALELVAIDNGRETVRRGNTIVGILAASHLYSSFNGVWYRPSQGLARRGIFGLTGTAGAVQSRLLPTPLGAGIVLTSKLALLRMPDPEIRLPAGTELILRVRSASPSRQANSPLVPTSSGTYAGLSDLPSAVTRQNGAPVRDVMHLAFVGEAAEIASAFKAAGWFPADPDNARAVGRVYAAYASMTTYERAPVSPLLYDNRLPDLVFQKSLNSISKRHHIRIWQEPAPGAPIFLAAATHDVGIAVRWNRMLPTHEVDPEIDNERTKVINDLLDAGCVAGIDTVDRPEISRQMTGKGQSNTDGRLLIVTLQPCTAPSQARSPEIELQHGMIKRAVRRTVLETRYYFTRGNAFYWMFRGIRSGVRLTATRRANPATPDDACGSKGLDQAQTGAQ
jgi:hypothetical protein